MMNYIWTFLIVFSLISAIYYGNMGELSSGVINSGNTAVNLCISLLGTFCLWNGIMNVAEKSGLSKAFAKFLSPVLCRIFKGIKHDDEALLPISLNISSNLLGLSNAATPLGIEAMKRLAESNKNKTVPDNNMVLFVVMNTAALRLIPTTVAALRAKHQSENPLEIILPSIITSVTALTIGILTAKIFERIFKYD